MYLKAILYVDVWHEAVLNRAQQMLVVPPFLSSSSFLCFPPAQRKQNNEETVLVLEGLTVQWGNVCKETNSNNMSTEKNEQFAMGAQRRKQLISDKIKAGKTVMVFYLRFLIL